MAKNIALFIDGTWNDTDKKGETNVHKLFQSAKACAEDPDECHGVPVAREGSTQVVHYLEGVGTGRLRDQLWGGATGFGTVERIKEAYLFLALNYNPNHEDNVYLFGFSRGAYAARALAEFVGSVGLLIKKLATPENVMLAYELYVKVTRGHEPDYRAFSNELKDRIREISLPEGDPQPILIHFIGVWDTVRALKITFPDDNPKLPKHITHARHALALHELRPEFEPTLWEDWGKDWRGKDQSLQQAWFPGAHADVGGGYAKTDLSNVALRWIAWESAKHGLKWFFAKPLPVSEASSGTVHYETMIKPLAPREILSDSKLRSERIMKSFFMHETACKQLLSAMPRQYRVAGFISRLKWFLDWSHEDYCAGLAKVDQLTLDLHLALSFKYDKKPIR
jgi:uncharacterized protein (DUF2235 family)